MSNKKLLDKICGLIPGKVDDRLVLDAYELLQKAEHLLKKDIPSTVRENTLAFRKHTLDIRKAKGYVEDQHKYQDMQYGATTMKHAGCEIFAVYNALYTLDGSHMIPLPHMIRDFELEGMVFSGRFGTSPKSLVHYLNKKGYRTEMVTDPQEFDKIGNSYDSLILTMYNNAEDIRDQIHTVHIKGGEKGFTAHNVYCNGTVVGPAPSVTELISRFNKGKARGICLIGITKPL